VNRTVARTIRLDARLPPQEFFYRVRISAVTAAGLGPRSTLRPHHCRNAASACALLEHEEIVAVAPKQRVPAPMAIKASPWCHEVGSVAQGRSLAEVTAFDLAILDINVNGGSIQPVADSGFAGITVLFLSGYGAAGVPEQFPGRARTDEARHGGGVAADHRSHLGKRGRARARLD
jgi:hypothetical protein